MPGGRANSTEELTHEPLVGVEALLRVSSVCVYLMEVFVLGEAVATVALDASYAFLYP